MLLILSLPTTTPAPTAYHEKKPFLLLLILFIAKPPVIWKRLLYSMEMKDSKHAHHSVRTDFLEVSSVIAFLLSDRGL